MASVTINSVFLAWKQPQEICKKICMVVFQENIMYKNSWWAGFGPWTMKITGDKVLDFWRWARWEIEMWVKMSILYFSLRGQIASLRWQIRSYQVTAHSCSFQDMTVKKGMTLTWNCCVGARSMRFGEHTCFWVALVIREGDWLLPGARSVGLLLFQDAQCCWLVTWLWLKGKGQGKVSCKWNILNAFLKNEDAALVKMGMGRICLLHSNLHQKLSHWVG